MKKAVHRNSLVRKFFVMIVVSLLTIHPTHLQAQNSFDHSTWNECLGRVASNGYVNYAALKNDRALLDTYLDEVGALSIDVLGSFNREERIAFWINLYNASLVRLILDAYPVNSIEEIPELYDSRTIGVIGEYFSLRELRDELLRRGFRDERIMIALSSGRMDSPRLLPEAYVGNRLEEQLNRAANQFVDDPSLNLISPGGKKIYLSSLFHDFGEDFVFNYGSSDTPKRFSETEAAVIGFLLNHSRDPQKRLFLNTGRYKVDYLAYNSRLNDVSQVI